MARILHICNTLQKSKYLKPDNFLKFLSVKIRIYIKLSIQQDQDYLSTQLYMPELGVQKNSHFSFFLFFFKATRTLSRKKNCPKPPYNRAGCIAEPYNASRQPKFQFCQKVGKGRQVYVRVGRNIANAWLPCTNIWETSKGRNFISKA